MVDFGTTLTGWMRLRLSALSPSQEITIDYSDLNAIHSLAHVPNQDGFQTFNQQDVYIAGNEEAGVFCSKFNQHAFRYAVIAGLSQAPALDTMPKRCPSQTDLETAGDVPLFQRTVQPDS